MTAAKPLAALVRAAALLATTLATAAPATGGEHTVFTMLPIDDADAPGRCPVDGLLAVPATWQYGDAAAIFIAPPHDATTGRDGLIAGLLAEGTAVLEISDSGRCQGDAPALARDALRDAIGPGVVVAIGYGTAGATALAAAGHGAVAGIAVGHQAVRIAAGPPASPEERFDRRWPRFCAILSQAAPIAAPACTAALPPAPTRFAEAPR